MKTETKVADSQMLVSAIKSNQMLLAEEGAGGVGEVIPAEVGAGGVGEVQEKKEAEVKTEEVEGSMMRANFAAGIEI